MCLYTGYIQHRISILFVLSKGRYKWWGAWDVRSHVDGGMVEVIDTARGHVGACGGFWGAYCEGPRAVQWLFEHVKDMNSVSMCKIARRCLGLLAFSLLLIES